MNDWPEPEQMTFGVPRLRYVYERLKMLPSLLQFIQFLDVTFDPIETSFEEALDQVILSLGVPKHILEGREDPDADPPIIVRIAE